MNPSVNWYRRAGRMLFCSDGYRLVLETLLLVVTFFGLLAVVMQLKQANDHQRWSNYNQLNIHYADWYQRMPEGVDDICDDFTELDAATSRWVRSYFNLYSEQHHLFQQRLIPDEMWTRRISEGVDVSLRSYPVLIAGYEYWKARGAFGHPVDFIPMVDQKIASLREAIDLDRKDCTERLEKEVTTSG